MMPRGPPMAKTKTTLSRNKVKSMSPTMNVLAVTALTPAQVWHRVPWKYPWVPSRWGYKVEASCCLSLVVQGLRSLGSSYGIDSVQIVAISFVPDLAVREYQYSIFTIEHIALVTAESHPLVEQPVGISWGHA